MYLGLFADMVRIHFFPSLWNRVIAKFSRKRMTAEQSLGAEPGAAQNAKSLDCVVRVHRTGGFEAAASRKQDGEIRLVATKREKGSANQQAGAGCRPKGWRYDFRSRRKSAVSASNGAFATEVFG